MILIENMLYRAIRIWPPSDKGVPGDRKSRSDLKKKKKRCKKILIKMFDEARSVRFINLLIQIVLEGRILIYTLNITSVLQLFCQVYFCVFCLIDRRAEGVFINRPFSSLSGPWYAVMEIVFQSKFLFFWQILCFKNNANTIKVE